eukprot:2003205-Lingulodinium_polyedra.AAC.1
MSAALIQFSPIDSKGVKRGEHCGAPTLVRLQMPEAFVIYMCFCTSRAWPVVLDERADAILSRTPMGRQ